MSQSIAMKQLSDCVFEKSDYNSFDLKHHQTSIVYGRATRTTNEMIRTWAPSAKTTQMIGNRNAGRQQCCRKIDLLNIVASCKFNKMAKFKRVWCVIQALCGNVSDARPTNRGRPTRPCRQRNRSEARRSATKLRHRRHPPRRARSAIRKRSERYFKRSAPSKR